MEISLTDAGRAVPMPDSAHFVEQLDRNPFPGQGLHGQGQAGHRSNPAPPPVRKIPVI